MIVYVLSVNGALVARFDALPDAVVAYPFDMGLLPPDAGRWMDATHGRVRRWELIEAGIACVITEVQTMEVAA